MDHHVVACNTPFGINHFLFSNMASFFFFWVQGPPPMPELDFGLCARVPPRFCPILSPRSIFHLVSGFPSQNTWLPFFQSLTVPVTSFPVPVTSFPVMWLPLEPTILLVRGFPFPWQPLDQSEAKTLSTNQKSALAAIWAHITTMAEKRRSTFEGNWTWKYWSADIPPQPVKQALVEKILSGEDQTCVEMSETHCKSWLKLTETESTNGYLSWIELDPMMITP